VIPDGHRVPSIRSPPSDTQTAGDVERLQQALVHDLGERVKELTALHTAGRLLNDVGTPAELLRQVAALLPPAWQYPEIAAARIAVGAIDVRTEGFTPTAWMQRAAFTTGKGDTGLIEVVYLAERPHQVEGPFLAEERNLLESLARMLGAYFDRLNAEDDRMRMVRAEAARAEAHQANQAKDQFIATLSHELRAPLNVMLGWTSMLRSRQLSPERASRGLDILDRSVRVQAQLIEDLLDVSRIVTGKLRIALQDVDIAAVASLAVDAARPGAATKKITLHATIPTELTVRADPARLQQIVSNLLTNALKFTPGGGRVDLALERRDRWVSIVVRDTETQVSACRRTSCRWSSTGFSKAIDRRRGRTEVSAWGSLSSSTSSNGTVDMSRLIAQAPASVRPSASHFP
jgi:signal transduction histidine kinase